LQKDGAAGRGKNAGLALTALGIVYGDLGTSPLYTMHTVIEDAGGHVDPTLALGILSLIFWTLVITISVKYCGFVMRADNHGEGGILALMSLIGRNSSEGGRFLVYCGVERRRRGGCGDQYLGPLYHADLGGDSGGVVCCAALRHGEYRAFFRAGDAGLVRADRAAGDKRHPPAPGGAAGGEPV
jgi:hypothetical protein